jgi:hypothetical protein
VHGGVLPEYAAQLVRRLGQPYRGHDRGHQLIDVLLFDRFVV